MKIEKISQFSDLKHSIHVFDTKGNRLADIDKDGVRVYGNTLNIAVNKETGEENGWTKSEMIYLSNGLKEVIKLKNRAYSIRHRGGKNKVRKERERNENGDRKKISIS